MDNSNQKETFHFNEETLKELIISFEDLKSKIVYKEKNIEKTFSSILFKLPIPLFLRKVCIYLSEDDIIKLTQTCSILRKIIYSPIGMKILIRSHKTLVNVNYTQPEIQDNSSNISFSTFINKVPNDNYSGGMSFEGEDTIAQLQTLKSVKEFLTEKVRENEALIVKLKKEIDDMKNHLRIEKQINSKSVNKIQVLETKIKGYETEKNEQNERTKELNTKYTNIVKYYHFLYLFYCKFDIVLINRYLKWKVK